MSDEEQKNEETQDEGAPAAGPDEAAEESGLTRPETSASSPPAEETVEAEAPADAAEVPAAEGEGAEPNPEDELPWKERRRLQRSRRPHKAKPQRSAEERVEERAAARKGKAELRRKQRSAAKGEKKAGTGTPVAEKESNASKVRQGVVTSDKGDKTIVVRIDLVRRHPTYEKVIRRSRTLHAHDERNEAGEGDTVRVVETRPLSKTKRWRLVEVLEKAK